MTGALFFLSPQKFTALCYLLIPEQMDAIIASKAAEGLEADRKAWTFWIVFPCDSMFIHATEVSIYGYRLSIYGEC